MDVDKLERNSFHATKKSTCQSLLDGGPSDTWISWNFENNWEREREWEQENGVFQNNSFQGPFSTLYVREDPLIFTLVFLVPIMAFDNEPTMWVHLGAHLDQSSYPWWLHHQWRKFCPMFMRANEMAQILRPVGYQLTSSILHRSGSSVGNRGREMGRHHNISYLVNFSEQLLATVYNNGCMETCNELETNSWSGIWTLVDASSLLVSFSYYISWKNFKPDK